MTVVTRLDCPAVTKRDMTQRAKANPAMTATPRHDRTWANGTRHDMAALTYPDGTWADETCRA